MRQNNFTSIYSGKPLAEIPFEHLWAEMPILGKEFGEGKIAEIIQTDGRGKPVKGIKMRWIENTESGPKIIDDVMLHSEIKHVSLK